MSMEANKATVPSDPKTPAVPRETAEGEPVQHADEGVNLFRGLIIMALFYSAFGFLIWFVWTVFSHWRGH